MELDAQCCGTLDIDELKLLMVLMGEKMDQDELKELLDEYDTDKSGTLDFKEFVIMMKGWNTRFGSGLARLYNVATKRGHIGKAAREFKRWWNRYFNQTLQRLLAVIDFLFLVDQGQDGGGAGPASEGEPGECEEVRSGLAAEVPEL